MHEATTYKPPSQRQPAPERPKKRDEWQCSACQATNWRNRSTCRRCGTLVAPDAVLLLADPSAAAVPPLTPKPSPLGPAPGAAAAPAARGKPADPVKLAEDALAAAKAASMAPEMITQMETTLTQRRQEAAGGEICLSKRLTLATNWKGESKTLLDEAEERLTAAQAAAEVARFTHTKAAAEVQQLTAEIAKSVTLPPAPPAPERACLANVLAAMSQLNTIAQSFSFCLRSPHR